MCGIYISVQQRAADLVELYTSTAVGNQLAPSYNVAPTTDVYAVVEHADRKTDEMQSCS